MDYGNESELIIAGKFHIHATYPIKGVVVEMEKQGCIILSFVT